MVGKSWLSSTLGCLALFSGTVMSRSSATVTAAPPLGLTLMPEPTESHTLEKRLWRNEPVDTKVREACAPVTFTTGTIFLPSTTLTLNEWSRATYTPICIHGKPVTYVSNKGRIELITELNEGWKYFISTTYGDFRASIFPLLYALSSSLVLNVIINVLIIDKNDRPLMQKLAITLSTVYLIIVFAFATVLTKRQYNKGFISAETVRHRLETDITTNILNLIFNIFILLAEIQTLMSLFPRLHEKRIIFWCGCALLIVGQALWAVTIFHRKAGDGALAAFAYLFEISIAILYAAVVIYYAVTKRRSTISNDLGFQTAVAILACFAPIALFIVDLGGWWIIVWNDSVSWLTGVLSIVVVWEWAVKVEQREREKENDRVMGRRVFESDNNYPHSSSSHSGEDGNGSGRKVSMSGDSEESSGLLNFLKHRVLRPIIWMSDQLVELGYYGIQPRADYFDRSPVLDVERMSVAPSTTGKGHQRPDLEMDTLPQFIHEAPNRHTESLSGDEEEIEMPEFVYAAHSHIHRPRSFV